jgi:enoyl-CoA hydratase
VSAPENAILIERDARVATITLDRPAQRNALSDALLGELADALAALDDDPSIGCIVLTGGERQFAAGADLRELAGRGLEEVVLGPRTRLWSAVRSTRQPLLAAVSGWCLGGGLELALACDLIVASETAVFGQPELAVGLIPGGGATQLLVRAVGRALAADVVLAGRTLEAQEALVAGLIARVLPLARWQEGVRGLAAEIADKPAIASRLAKQALRLAEETPLSAGIAFERAAFHVALGVTDAAEGIDAFLGRRAPHWAGRAPGDAMQRSAAPGDRAQKSAAAGDAAQAQAVQTMADPNERAVS